MKKHGKSSQRSEATLKRTKVRGPVQRDAKEVMAEVLGKLTGKLDAPAVSRSAKENRRGKTVGPNLDRLTVGVDLGDRWSQYCILGLKGETLAEGQLRTTQEDVREFFQALTVARGVIEVGTHSAWVQDVITESGHEVLVANPRLMEGSKRRKRKSDRIDANKLARLGRVDPQSLYPIRHRSREVRQDLVVLRARDALVSDGVDQHRTRTGEKYGYTTAAVFEPELRRQGKGCDSGRGRRSAAAFGAVGVETVNDCIAKYDQKIEELGREKYGHTTLLRQVKGVGPITSLAYVLTLEDPQRFSSSREVGPYLGLVPKQEDSGDSQPQLGISKTGDRMLRRLLVGSSQYMLGAFGPDSDLRRYGCGCVNAEERMRRSEPWWRWPESWPCCCITCG